MDEEFNFLYIITIGLIAVLGLNYYLQNDVQAAAKINSKNVFYSNTEEYVIEPPEPPKDIYYYRTVLDWKKVYYKKDTQNIIITYVPYVNNPKRIYIFIGKKTLEDFKLN